MQAKRHLDINFDFNRPQQIEGSRSLAIVLSRGSVMVAKQGGFAFIEYDSIRYLPIEVQFELAIGSVEGRPIIAVEIAHNEEAEGLSASGFTFTALWSLLQTLNDIQTIAVSRALQLIKWNSEHKFCGICGEKTALSKSEFLLVCPKCNREHWPKISPCVIVLVSDGEKLLLARNKSFNIPIYSTIAGFIESGETAEACVAREVNEEVGIEIENIRYFGSQAWPFPAQLMLGFNADYVSGEVVPDGIEIVSADFFHYTNLPNVPTNTTSIAGQLIAAKLRELQSN